jgi:hypothetical protein
MKTVISGVVWRIDINQLDLPRNAFDFFQRMQCQQVVAFQDEVLLMLRFRESPEKLVLAK